MDTFYVVIEIIGLFVQILGLILFGVTVGWLTLYVIKQPEKNWQLQSIVYSVFLVFVALFARYLTAGALGAFLLGAAGAMIFWGLIQGRVKSEKKK
jgi:NhaP-type Na+/H+ or K+/H+ antiporter